MSRQLPPFGRDLSARLADPSQRKKLIGTSADGHNPQIWVMCGPDGWEVARAWHKRRLVMHCPADADPYRYDWCILARFAPGIVVPCGHVDQIELHCLADAILRDGSSKVLVLANHGIARYIRADAKEVA